MKHTKNLGHSRQQSRAGEKSQITEGSLNPLSSAGEGPADL